MFVASKFILISLQSDARSETGELIFNTLTSAEKATIRTNDLAIIRDPYVILGFVVIAMLIVIALYKMPETNKVDNSIHPIDSFKRLLKNIKYREGVIAQVFYVAAQIMCWTFIIQYADNIGIPKAEAQDYNIIAMVILLLSRFISTYLMKFTNSRLLLMLFAIGGISTTLGVVFIQGIVGLYCLVATSAFMSLMFPTIYGIALEGLKKDTTLGAAGLVMAIVGGALMPPLQGSIIDLGTVAGLPAVNVSFVLPLISFVVISIYGYRTYKVL